jgi:ribosomal protein L40E
MRISTPAWMMSSETSTETQPFEPWQFFTLAGLIGATIVVFFAKGQTAAAIILLSLTVFAAAAVGFAALRAIGPLAGLIRTGDAPPAGSRTRAALEREKALALHAIKELEFDRAMGKVSEKDFTEMSGRLRARAARMIRQLDANGSYRDRIEKEIEKRIGRATNACTSCQAVNDLDARFCKKCGTALGAQS